eukprot:Nk52_evm29s32 gene=Nk52_evmTU29s32
MDWDNNDCTLDGKEEQQTEEQEKKEFLLMVQGVKHILLVTLSVRYSYLPAAVGGHWQVQVEMDPLGMGSQCVGFNNALPGVFKDRIVASCLFRAMDDGGCCFFYLAAAFAHNFVEVYKVGKCKKKRDGEKTELKASCQPIEGSLRFPSPLLKRQSEEHCILYCAQMYFNNVNGCSQMEPGHQPVLSLSDALESLVVGSGTVFNETLLWRPFAGLSASSLATLMRIAEKSEEKIHGRGRMTLEMNSEGLDGDAPVLARLVGHEGVLFSICIYSMPQTENENGWICTTSDDRTVRVWSVGGREWMEASAALGGNGRGALKNLTEKGKQVPLVIDGEMVLYGHTSRVWDCRMVEVVGGLYAVSIGEDATCRVWDLNEKLEAIDAPNKVENEQPSYSKKLGNEKRLITTFRGHYGRSVWSMAVNEQDLVVATGGGDCSVRLWGVGFLKWLNNNKQKEEKATSLDRIGKQQLFLLENEVSERTYSIPEECLRMAVRCCSKETRAVGVGEEVSGEFGQEVVKKRKVLYVNEDIALAKKDLFPRNVAFRPQRASQNQLVTVSNSGGVYLCNTPSDSNNSDVGPEWQLVSYDANFQRYTVMAYLEEEDILLVGDIDGNVSFIDVRYKDHIVRTSGCFADAMCEEKNLSNGMSDVHKVDLNSGNVKWKAHSGKIQSLMWCASSPFFDSSSHKCLERGKCQKILFVFTSGVNDPMCCWKITLVNTEPSTCRRVRIACVGRLQIPKNEWIQTATFSAPNRVISGDRKGNVYSHVLQSFTLTNAIEVDSATVCVENEYLCASGTYEVPMQHCKKALDSVLLTESRQVIPRAHGKTGVTDIAVTQRTKGNFSGQMADEEYLVMSCGRDGYLNYYRNVTKEGQMDLIECVAHEKVSKKLEWLSKIVFMDSENGSGQEIVVLGFFNVKFVVWNVTTNRMLFQEIECGGGHRDWDFRFVSDSVSSEEDEIERRDGNIEKMNYVSQQKRIASSCRFVHIRKGIMYVMQINNKSTLPPVYKREKLQLAPFHGREVLDIKLLKLSDVFGSSLGGIKKLPTLVFTSSEDSKVIINLMSQSLRGGLCIDGHSSSVRTMDYLLPWEPEGGAMSYPNSFVLFTAGGHETIQCWSILCDQDERRNSNLSHRRLGGYQPNKADKRAEMNLLSSSGILVENLDSRFMSVSSQRISPSVSFLFSGCSDGIVRLFIFCESTRRFYLLGLSDFHNKCVLNVSLFKGPRGKLFACSSATDGKIAFWDLSEFIDIASAYSSSPRGAPNEPKRMLSPPVHVFGCHQSGVNAFDLKLIGTLDGDSHTEYEYFLVSGGDDNAITIWTFIVSVENNCGNPAFAECKVHSTVSSTQPSAHGSSVTCVKLLPMQHQSPSLSFVSSGWDQRLCLWQCTIKRNDHNQHASLQFKLSASFNTDVADVSSLDVSITNNGTQCETFDIVVGGVGMQRVQISL